MSAYVKGFRVILETDVNQDAAECIQNAIQSLRHVLKVEPIESEGALDSIEMERVRHKYFDALLKTLKERV